MYYEFKKKGKITGGGVTVDISQVGGVLNISYKVEAKTPWYLPNPPEFKGNIRVPATLLSENHFKSNNSVVIGGKRFTVSQDKKTATFANNHLSLIVSLGYDGHNPIDILKISGKVYIFGEFELVKT